MRSTAEARTTPSKAGNPAQLRFDWAKIDPRSGD
jgi:hypothetical protein